MSATRKVYFIAVVIALAIVGSMFLFSQSRDVTTEIAHRMIDGCINLSERNCYYKGSVSHDEIKNSIFSQKEVSHGRQGKVYFFTFKTKKIYCAYVEIIDRGFGRMEHSVEFYRCVEAPNLKLGLG